METSVRSSRPEVFCKKGVLRNFAGKHLCQSLFFKKETLALCEISKNTFFTEHLWWLLLQSLTSTIKSETNVESNLSNG